MERDDEGDYGDEDFQGTRTTRESDNGESLSKTKLEQKDYLRRAKSAKNVKKGKYGVTVPKPFGFDMRDKTKTKGIRERKIEADVMDKKLEMDGIIKYQFRHKPVPPEVLIPRFNNI